MLLLLGSATRKPPTTSTPSWPAVVVEKVGTYSNGDERVVVRVASTFNARKGDALTLTKP